MVRELRVEGEEDEKYGNSVDQGSRHHGLIQKQRWKPPSEGKHEENRKK